MRKLSFAIGVVMMAAPIAAQTDTTSFKPGRPAELEPETPTGSRIPVNPTQVEKGVVRRMSKDFARCAYRKNPALAERVLLSSDPAAIDLAGAGIAGDEVIKKFSLSNCLSWAMSENQSSVMFRFDSRKLRSMFAEEAYLAQNKQPLTLAEQATELVSERVILPESTDGRAQALGNFADCLVFQGPQQADALLRSRPTSADENDAVQALVPAISACLYEGQEVSLTPDNIRGLVADGLWTRSYYTKRGAQAAMSQEVRR